MLDVGANFGQNLFALRETAASAGCDAKTRPELFQLDQAGRPLAVAGVPPDYFAADGQLWGNPLYAWERHAADGFAWWKARVHHDLELFDAIRIDGGADAGRRRWRTRACRPAAEGGRGRETPRSSSGRGACPPPRRPLPPPAPPPSRIPPDNVVLEYSPGVYEARGRWAEADAWPGILVGLRRLPRLRCCN